MSLATHQEIKICPDCGADCRPTDKWCWLCRADIRRQERIVVAQAVADSPRREPPRGLFEISTVFVVSLAFVIGVGIFLLAPGIGIVWVIVVVPSLIAVMVRIRRLQTEGRASQSKFLSRLAMSAALVLSAIGLAAFAAFAAMMVYCFIELSSMSFH